MACLTKEASKSTCLRAGELHGYGEPVSGMGDAAVFDVAKLYLRKGETYIEINPINATDEIGPDVIKNLQADVREFGEKIAAALP